MKRAPYFARVTGTAGLWQPQKPGFASLAQQTLGNSGSPADGTDSQLLSLLNAFNSAGSLLDAITLSGTQLAAAKTAADSIPMGDIGPAIDAATAASNGSIAKIGAALGLLAQSPTAPGGLGPAPSPPVIDVSGVGSQPASGGQNPFSEATYAEGVTTEAASLISHFGFAWGLSSGVIQGATVWLPIIGAAIGIALILVHYLGHGCGEPCIDAAKAEQIYEAAADDIFAVYKLGMITAAQAVAIMVHMFSAGTQHMAGFNTQQANKGVMNMQKVISALIAQVPHTAQAKATPLNLNAAHIDYVQGAGWYPDSVTAAGELADEYLTALSSQKGA